MDDRQISRLEKKYNIEISEAVDLDKPKTEMGRLDRAYRIYDREDKSFFYVKVRDMEPLDFAIKKAMGDF